MNGTRRTSTRTGAGRDGWQPAVPVLIALVLLIPAVGLFGLWRFADARAATPEPLPLLPEEGSSTPPASALDTGLLSWRRTPELLALQANLAALEADVDGFAGSLTTSGCVQVNIDGGPVSGHERDAPFIPASSLKVVTTAVALDVWGADHRFTTSVHGNVGDNGVVGGDLFLVGGGDPLIFTDDYPAELERYPIAGTTSLDELADAVVGAGVTRIEGDIVGDGSRYDDERYHSSWVDEDLGTEAGPIGALVVNRGRVNGEIQLDADPAESAAAAFAGLLAARGVEIAGTSRAGVGGQQPPSVAQVDSVPLADIVSAVLTNSDNNAAEMLIKELGTTAEGDSGGVGSWAAGRGVMMERLDAMGVPLAGVELDDGSGLSTENRLTCAALAAVLDRFGLETELGEAMGVAGESGTLAGEFAGSAVHGELRAKTGTLANLPVETDPPASKALAGYLPADNGDTITVVLLLNGATINDPAEYRPVWDQLMSALDAYPSGPGADELGP